MLAGVLLLFTNRFIRFIAPLPTPGCPVCGYEFDLGKVAICPECGVSLDASNAKTPQPDPD